MKNKPVAFVDVETTGLDPDFHEIIEICIIIDKKVYHQKVHPTQPHRIDEKAVAVNGYHPKEWTDAITPKQAAHDVGRLLSGHIIIGHNPRFDYQFLKSLLEDHNVDSWLDPRCVDTTTLSFVHLVPHGIRRLNMDEIRKFLGWNVNKFHNAYKDTQDVKRLFRLLTSPMKRIITIYKLRVLRWLGVIDGY